MDFTLQLAPSCLLVPSSRLLEEKCNIVPGALVPDIDRPLGGHRSGHGPAFAADDDPIDSTELQFRERSDEGLTGKEAHRSRDTTKIVDAISDPLVLDADSHPDVLGPASIRWS